MKIAATAALCLVSLAPRAGAEDFARPSPARGAMTPTLSPNFSANVPLQRGGSFGVQTLTDKVMNLPGAAELQQLGASMFAPKKSLDAVPSLPQSAVVLGESGRTISPALRASLTPQDARSLSPSLEHFFPAASRRASMRSVEQDLTEKAEKLEAPLAAVSRTGADAPSSSELKRLGAEIWEIMSAPAGGRSTVRTVQLADAAASGVSGVTVSESLLSLADGHSGAPRHSAAVPESSSLEAAEKGNSATVSGHSRVGTRSNFSAETAGGFSRVELPGGVALVAMDVVGQSLILSESGPAFRASREVAASVSGSLQSGAFIGGVESAGGRRSDSGSHARQFDHMVKSAGSLSSVNRSDASTGFGPSMTARGRGVMIILGRGFDKGFGPGPWSWAALLPLLLLGFAALPEYR